MPTAIARLIAAVTVVTLIACSATITSVTIDGGDRTIILGDTLTLTATSTTDPTRNDTITINPPGALRWTRHFGTNSDDIARGTATDANGNTYTTGNTAGALEGSNAGNADAFIRSYDRDGNLRWTHQFGTNSDDVSLGIATDPSGNAYTTGYTSGALEGSSAGGVDAFIRSYGR